MVFDRGGDGGIAGAEEKGEVSAAGAGGLGHAARGVGEGANAAVSIGNNREARCFAEVLHGLIGGREGIEKRLRVAVDEGLKAGFAGVMEVVENASNGGEVVIEGALKTADEGDGTGRGPGPDGVEAKGVGQGGQRANVGEVGRGHLQVVLALGKLEILEGRLLGVAVKLVGDEAAEGGGGDISTTADFALKEVVNFPGEGKTLGGGEVGGHGADKGDRRGRRASESELGALVVEFTEISGQVIEIDPAIEGVVEDLLDEKGKLEGVLKGGTANFIASAVISRSHGDAAINGGQQGRGSSEHGVFAEEKELSRDGDGQGGKRHSITVVETKG